ncbi:MAG: type II secretion system protein M [Candidatus Binataceae bacterium]|nr:type II secretion system protein M [Candidatus Binataceae bacterium]
MFAGIREKIGELWSAQVRRLRGAIDPYSSQARAYYTRLEPREKMLVRIAAGAMALFIAYNFIYLPVVDLRGAISDNVTRRQRELIEVRGLTRTYLRLKDELATTHKRTVPAGRDFSLFTVVETALTGSVGHDKLGSITPGIDRKVSDNLVEYRVDLQLNDLSLPQLIDALYRLQNLTIPITVSSLHVKRRFQNPHSYDVELTCSALGKNA